MSGLLENRDPEKVKGKLAYLRENFGDGKGKILEKRHRVLEPSQLPTWVKDAIFQHDVNGQSWRRICERKNKKPSGLQKWIGTPGAKKLRAAIAEVVGDPVGTVKLKAKMDSAWAYNESLKLYRICIEAGDRAEAGRLLRHFNDLSEVKTAAGPVVATQIVVNMGGGQSFSVEAPMGEATHEVVKAEIVEDE